MTARISFLFSSFRPDTSFRTRLQPLRAEISMPRAEPSMPPPHPRLLRADTSMAPLRSLKSIPPPARPAYRSLTSYSAACRSVRDRAALRMISLISSAFWRSIAMRSWRVGPATGATTTWASSAGFTLLIFGSSLRDLRDASRSSADAADGAEWWLWNDGGLRLPPCAACA